MRPNNRSRRLISAVTSDMHLRVRVRVRVRFSARVSVRVRVRVRVRASVLSKSTTAH